jgi:hypothetical protein
VAAVLARGQLFLVSRADGMVGWSVFFWNAGVDVDNVLFVNILWN